MPKQSTNREQPPKMRHDVRLEFMKMALDAMFSKTPKYSKSKTHFIARLLSANVDAKTMANLNRALAPKTG